MQWHAALPPCVLLAPLAVRASLQLAADFRFVRVFLQPNAGQPMDLSGNIVLCSRADGNATRHFDGKLAYLGEWASE